MTHLKGGHVMAIRARIDGETKEIRNEDGRPRNGAIGGLG